MFHPVDIDNLFRFLFPFAGRMRDCGARLRCASAWFLNLFI